MDDETVLSFQARTEARLYRPVIRRILRPIVLAVCGAFLLLAAVLGLAGLVAEAVIVVVASVGTAVLLPWYGAQEKTKLESAKIGHVVGYRLDRAGIEMMGGFDARRWPWSAVTRVEPWRGQVAVFFGWRTIVGIPTGTLSAAEQARLLQVLRSRGKNFSGAGNLSAPGEH